MYLIYIIDMYTYVSMHVGMYMVVHMHICVEVVMISPVHNLGKGQYSILSLKG